MTLTNYFINKFGKILVRTLTFPITVGLTLEEVLNISLKPMIKISLKNSLKKQKKKKLNTTILGAGSNTLFRDNGVKGAVIKLGKDFSYTKLLKKIS